jgi:cleavage stimulation factor subunit 3
MAWFGSCICDSDDGQRDSNRFLERYLAEQGRTVGLLGKSTKQPVRQTDTFRNLVEHFIVELVEYHCTKSMDVASRIFEKGLQFFGEEIEYVLRYLGFLISVNDENS